MFNNFMNVLSRDLSEFATTIKTDTHKVLHHDQDFATRVIATARQHHSLRTAIGDTATYVLPVPPECEPVVDKDSDGGDDGPSSQEQRARLVAAFPALSEMPGRVGSLPAGSEEDEFWRRFWYRIGAAMTRIDEDVRSGRVVVANEEEEEEEEDGCGPTTEQRLIAELQREVRALRQENDELRKNLAAATSGASANTVGDGGDVVADDDASDVKLEDNDDDVHNPVADEASSSPLPSQQKSGKKNKNKGKSNTTASTKNTPSDNNNKTDDPVADEEWADLGEWN